MSLLAYWTGMPRSQTGPQIWSCCEPDLWLLDLKLSVIPDILMKHSCSLLPILCCEVLNWKHWHKSDHVAKNANLKLQIFEKKYAQVHVCPPPATWSHCEVGAENPENAPLSTSGPESRRRRRLLGLSSWVWVYFLWQHGLGVSCPH